MSQARASAQPRSGVHRFAGPAAEANLVCFPHAGAWPTVYQPWAADLAGRFTVWAASVRHRDLTPADGSLWPRYARRQADALEAVGGPLTLYGHSMGAVSAYETARELRRRGREITRLVVSGCDAPHVRTTAPPPDDPRALVRAVAERYGGVPAPVLDDPELLQVFGEDMHADFTALARYVHADGPPLDVALTVVGGTADPAVTESGLRAWAECATGPFRVERLPGGHFFTDAERVALLALLD